MESQYEKKIEDLMQQNYQLKSLVEEYKSKEDWYKEEISQFEEATSRNESNNCDREFKAKEIKLREKISSLRLELESAQQGETIQQERITELEKIVEENQQLNPEFNGTKTDCDETMGISREEQITQLHEEIAALKTQLRTDKTDALALKLEVNTLKQTLAENEEELVSVKIECSSYCNLLETARTENLELMAQLDVLVMQEEQQSHKTKGNSLFSELESRESETVLDDEKSDENRNEGASGRMFRHIDDRRIEAEKVLVSQKNSYDTMKKKTELLKGQNRELKMQLVAALGTGNGESDRVETLEVQLEQERSERKVLMDKIKKLEEYQVNEKITERLSEFSQKVTTGDKGVDKDYIEYLVNMVISKEEDIQELSRQLHIQGICLLDQKNKVVEKEKLLYSVGVKKDELFRTCQQLKMEKAELELELKPDHSEIADIARKHTGTKDIKNAYKRIHKEIKKRFPGHILEEKDTEWLFMNAGGWMGSIYILHASLTEYILFFGTAIDTSGNSGRYWANISDTLLTGSFLLWKEGELESRLFKPGDTVLHEWGEVTAVQWERGTWMVEYARGFIPSTLGFALADTLFSTTDFVTLFYILRVYTKALMLETSTYLLEMKEFIKESL